MQTLRNAKMIARFVLVWFALSIGLAVASPIVKPDVMQLVCAGAGSIKVVVTSDDGRQSSISHTLNCPLCAGVGMLPETLTHELSYATPRTYGKPDAGLRYIWIVLDAPPPARGPPTLS